MFNGRVDENFRSRDDCVSNRLISVASLEDSVEAVIEALLDCEPSGFRAGMPICKPAAVRSIISSFCPGVAP